MKIQELDGLKQQGSEVNLLFYIPLGEKKLHAQFYNPHNEDVIHEIIIKDWNQALSALLTFKYLNGETLENLWSMLKTEEENFFLIKS